MNFNNKKIYLIGSVVILAGLFFLASTSSASAGGCSNNEAGLSFSKFLNPLASLAEKVVKGFGYEVALATAPDPDTCGSDDTNCLCSDPNTKLLLHMDGSNGSTNFVDSAQSRSVTANGNAQISTSQYKFGGASGYFDGSGDYLTVPDSSDWTFGTGDFTIDLWVRFSALQDSSFVSQTYLASPGYWTFWYSNSYYTLNFH